MLFGSALRLKALKSQLKFFWVDCSERIFVDILFPWYCTSVLVSEENTLLERIIFVAKF